MHVLLIVCALVLGFRRIAAEEVDTAAWIEELLDWEEQRGRNEYTDNAYEQENDYPGEGEDPGSDFDPERYSSDMAEPQYPLDGYESRDEYMYEQENDYPEEGEDPGSDFDPERYSSYMAEPQRDEYMYEQENDYPEDPDSDFEPERYSSYMAEPQRDEYMYEQENHNPEDLDSDFDPERYSSDMAEPQYPLHGYEPTNSDAVDSQAHDSEMSQLQAVDKLITQYIATGYNLLRANPDGDFSHGGADPGVKKGYRVLDISKKNGRLPYATSTTTACSSSKSVNVFSGTKSYQKKLDVNVAIAGSCALYIRTQYSN